MVPYPAERATLHVQVGPNHEWVGLSEVATAPPKLPPLLGGRPQWQGGGGVGGVLETRATWLRNALVVALLLVWAVWPALPTQGGGGSSARTHPPNGLQVCSGRSSPQGT